MESKVILDHGYVKLVETWGSDERIIEAARMSTNKGFEGWDKDSKLLAYLYNNNHSTPFEMAGAVIEVKAPIFIFREWHRHRTQSYNEMSARYVPMPDENYLPTLDRCRPPKTTNKQARGVSDKVPTDAEIEMFLRQLSEAYEYAESVYRLGLTMGIPKELARLPVPVARYSRMRAQANIRNWLGFLKLRQDTKAQWEIQQYANAVAEMLTEHFPRTMSLYSIGR
jgi:thymidylate synthase (FAD)